MQQKTPDTRIRNSLHGNELEISVAEFNKT